MTLQPNGFLLRKKDTKPMSVLTHLRCGSWNRLWLLAGICAASVLVPAISRAADPVDRLRQALKLDVGESVELQVSRKKMIDSAIQEAHTISQLRRAYFLTEWQGQEQADLQKARKEIGDKLTASIRRSAQMADLDQQLAAAMWIAELSEADQSIDAKDKFARGMTDIVLGLLKQKDVSVRQAALHALGRITPNPAEAFPPIKSTLQSDALGPRRLAAYALSDLIKNIKLHERDEQMEIMDKVISTALFSLRDADESIRGYSLQAILEAAKAFLVHITTPGEELTGEGKGKAVLKPNVRKILTTLQGANPQLLQALYDPKINVRLTAMQTLDQINNARFKIIQEFQKLAPERRDNSSQLLKTYNVPDPLGNVVERDWTFITRLLKEDDVRLRRSAMDFLELLGDQVQPALPEITQALRDPDSFVRWSAARTLRNVEPNRVSSDAVRALGQLVMDPDPDVSKAAAGTLEALGAAGPEAAEALGLVIANGDSENRSWDADTRIAAMRALVSIGPERTAGIIPRLMTALADADPRIRRAAAETLGRYGSTAHSALPALRQALRDDDSEVRLNASEAILNITAPRK
jgi:HEAT repeat protein